MPLSKGENALKTTRTHWKRMADLVLVACLLLLPTLGFAESLKDGVILRNDTDVILKDGSAVKCQRILWLSLAADFVQCNKGDHAVEIKLKDLDFEKTFGPELAREYAAMKGELVESHEEGRRKMEANKVTYESSTRHGLETSPGPHQGPDPALGSGPKGRDLPPSPLPRAKDDTKPGDKEETLEAALKILREGASPSKTFNAARAVAKQARAGADCTEAIAVLVERLDDERPVNVISSGGGFSGASTMRQTVSLAAKYALVSIGGPAVPALIQRMKENPSSGRGEGEKHAIVGLGEIGDTRAVEVLTRYAQQRGPGYRRDAVRALAQIQGPKAWEGLVSVLGSQDGLVRLEAGWGLIKMDKTRAGAAIDPYIDAMLADPDSKKKRSAINLAGECGLKRLAPDFVRFLEHKDPVVVHMALGALKKVGAPAGALPRLVALAEQKRENDAATGAIRTITDPAALRGLIDGLTHGDPKVREACIWSLGEIGRTDAVPALAKALSYDHRGTRFAALWALGKIPCPESIAALREAAKSEDPKFSRIARGQLKKQGYGN
jgi:HEAT repeat protein